MSTPADTPPSPDEPRRLGERSGWTPGSTDDLIEFAFGMLCCAVDAAKAAEFCPGWLQAWQRWQELYHVWIRRDSEETCHRCGRDYTPWSAPSPLWNEVMRGGNIDNPEPEPYRGLVCADCFIKLAEQGGIATQWQLRAAKVFRTLQTVTPTGRRWNDQKFLFEDPPPCTCPPPRTARQQVSGSQVGGKITQISGTTGDVNL